MFISNFYHTGGTFLPQTTAWDSVCDRGQNSDSASSSLSPSHGFLVKETQWSPLNTSLLCNKIDETFGSAFSFFYAHFLSEADQRPYLSVRQIINISVWTTKICHTNPSISMQFDFLLGEKLPRAGMVVPWCFTSALSQSNWFWSWI